MGALMGECKPPLPAQFSYLRRLNKAFVHQDLIATQRYFADDALNFDDVLGICIGRQPTDASIGRKLCERDLQAEIIAGELVNRCSTGQQRAISFGSEKECIEILCDRRSNLFNILVG